MRTNPFAEALPGFTNGGSSHIDQSRYQTRRDGTYRLVGLPGVAVVGAQSVHRDFRNGVGYQAIIDDKHPKGNYINTYRSPVNPSATWPNAMRRIDVPEGVLLKEANPIIEVSIDGGSRLQPVSKVLVSESQG